MNGVKNSESYSLVSLSSTLIILLLQRTSNIPFRNVS